MANLIDHPPHYNSHPSGIECIEITEHMNFNLGNAIKYIWRADEKGDDAADLHKAKWYIERELDRRKRLLIAETAAMHEDMKARGFTIRQLQPDGSTKEI